MLVLLAVVLVVVVSGNVCFYVGVVIIKICRKKGQKESQLLGSDEEIRADD